MATQPQRVDSIDGSSSELGSEVDLGYYGGGPPKSTCKIIPSSVTLSGSVVSAQVTVDLSVPKGASLGTFTVTFTGTSGTLTHSTTATLKVK